MFKSISKILVIIFLLALVLRTFELNVFPKGFHADEARVAWNSLSILKTGADDKGHFLDLYYDTFGDYRPTGIFYFTIPSLLMFERTEFAVRFPSALFGSLTIFPLFLLVKQVTKDKNIALFSSLLLAISPWHIQVSRATSEMVISSFFALFSFYFLIKLIKTGGIKNALLACLSITVSYFLYHAIRMLAPLFFLTIVVYYSREFLRSPKKLVLVCLIFVGFLTIFFSTTPAAKKRFEQVSIFTTPDIQYEINRLDKEVPFIKSSGFVYARRLFSEYSDYFNIDFLLGYAPKPYRYVTAGTTLITLAEAVFLLIGLIEIIRKKRNFLPLIFLLIAPLPAALTHEDSPNLHRAFLMVPFLVIIEAYGLEALIKFQQYQKLIRIISSVLLLISFLMFIYIYFNPISSNRPFIKEYSMNGYSHRNEGMKEMVLKVNDLGSKYDKIILTNFPDDPYPWYAFFTGKDPQEFNYYTIHRDPDNVLRYKNLVFSHVNCPSSEAFNEEKAPRLLVVNANSKDCPHDAEIKNGTIKAYIRDQIFLSNGSDVYVFLSRQ